eukprot:jgi/Picsp_1/2159/NSC_05624-R1_hypothetical protein CHLNCDRAFT_142500 [Chlorella variabilis]
MLKSFLIGGFTLFFLGQARGSGCPSIVGELSTLAHDVTGTVEITEDCQLSVENFSYDGEAPAAFFWAADACDPVSLSKGVFLSPEPVPGPNFQETLRLPVDDTIDFSSIGCISFYCVDFNADFGNFEVIPQVTTNGPSSE